MKYERYKALGVLIHVEIFDEDMREVIWPMSDEHDDPGIWLNKEEADRLSDDRIGRYFLNRYLIDYGNTYTYAVTRGKVEERNFVRRIKS